MRAKKSFGQHFLTNEHYAERIAGSLTGDGGRETADGVEQVRVLEVGPGKGMLTKYLLEKNYDLRVVEADADMVDYLHHHYPQLHGCIIAEDFLKMNLATVFNPQFDSSAVPSPKSPITNHQSPFFLIGNFPYNISSQIVFKMVENRHLVPQLAGMFQKEMAQRIIAPPGGKDYGVISVLTQAFYEGKYLFSVAPGNFNPTPKVQSGVIRLTRREAGIECDEALFRKVVKQAFSQRRKMLRNTLKPFFEKEPEALEEAYFTQRPEVLSVAEFVELTQRIAELYLT